ncbi:MAG: VWA domain-containing protein [Bacteroidetes bacterium]|nr:VWA domain-containing protein [Bacteroidota bacterium]HET6243947.1 VWA domain-containing protein [Bacteroidia bacterium]
MGTAIDGSEAIAITAPAAEKVRILFIFDASQSMLSYWQTGKKIDSAKKLLIQMVDSLKHVNNVEIALRVYGNQPNGKSSYTKDCKDSHLEVPFAASNHIKIKAKLMEIVPKGTTPIAYSLGQSANDFPQCSSCKNIIILITDGIEECEGNPCAVTLALYQKGVFLKPFIIGMGLGPEIMKEFECVGKYYDTENEETFTKVLKTVIDEAVNATTAQVNLLDDRNNPTETNVVMALYNNATGKIKYNYVHSLNHKGNPDTLIIEHEYSYKMIVYTLPTVEKENIKLIQGKHNTIISSTPQGSLSLKVSGYTDYKNLKAIVRLNGKMETINIQETNKLQKYLTGKYDLEVLTLPRIYVSDIEIKQSHTTTIEIPQPGIASVVLPSIGFASIYLEDNSGLKWIYNLDETKSRENITLQPGSYRIIYRSINAKESIYTSERSFKMEPGGSISVQL